MEAKNSEEPESLSESLVHSVANDYTKEVLTELGNSVFEDVTQALTHSELPTKIPVLGVFMAGAKGIMTYRDRRFANKLLGFLSETTKASEADKTKYREKLDKDPKEVNKAGAIILDLIDKITSIEKAKMIGKVFRAYMHEDNITTEQLIYLCEIIERTYLQDLVSLEKSEFTNDSNLESVGIRKPIRVEDINRALKAFGMDIENKIPTVKEGILQMTNDKAEVEQSGLTDAGYKLQRILRSYQ